MPWAPAPTWQPLTSGTGQSNGGVWLTPDHWVVKRLVAAVDHPRHHAYWRRQPLVAESALVAATPGLRSPACLKVQWDDTGATMWTAQVSPTPLDALALAEALGRFARAQVPEPSWGARDILRDRLTTVSDRGGWTTLDSKLPTDLQRAVQDFWVRRDAALAELDALPRVPTHGDAHPGNLLGHDGDNVIAVDWEQFGLGPAGFDLGYLLLAVDLPLDELLPVFEDRDAVRRGAVLTAAFTAVSRAAWSLSRTDPGDHVDRLVHLSDLVAEACDSPGAAGPVR
ncbi:MAG TPA: aminoglycoside phosphotransferase family protein [Kribbella sp.]|uniref:phosphotransferase family protein n=1 Tax=Kribbella sp. TaxID=1871183 RepID=UPI002D77195C|nr:aminoglycoside phosphotransferase family protein [Kribbella sp.]HET6293999.1 aminoglycoside phosphotransferase family protein [Kribbella sp.]